MDEGRLTDRQGHIVDFGRTIEIADAGIMIKLKKEDIQKAKACLKQQNIQFNSYGESSVLLPGADDTLQNACLHLLLENGVIPIEFSVKKQSLVDIFMSYTG